MRSITSENGAIRIAIQGELGSNSHMAARELAATWPDRPFHIVPCQLAVQVFERLAENAADLAVLPIENSLHGSVFEHYDLLLEHHVQIIGERMLRIEHNVIAMAGVRLSELRCIRSHPVALSQCRRWLRAHPDLVVEPCYDTAGSVKQVMERGERDAAGIAPRLAAETYGAEVLESGIEDHVDNFTRFLVLSPTTPSGKDKAATKMSVAFTLKHEPGTLLAALAAFQGLNLTKIESRPVQGRPWEYVFFVDVRFAGEAEGRHAVEVLRAQCERVDVLGIYAAA